jgi:hypothetical protein
LKTMICRNYSFPKLTQFSQGNHELDAYASDTHGFLLGDTCVSSTQLNRPTWTNLNLTPSWKLWFAGHIPFFWQNHMFLLFSWISLFGIKWVFFHLETCDFQELFLSKTNSILTGYQCSRCSCF